MKSWSSWVASVKGACEGAWKGIFKQTERKAGESGSMGAIGEKKIECLLSVTKRKGMKVLKIDYSIKKSSVPERRTS